jgi:hypothetical protein
MFASMPRLHALFQRDSMMIAEAAQSYQVEISGDSMTPSSVVIPPFNVSVVEKAGALSLTCHTWNIASKRSEIWF